MLVPGRVMRWKRVWKSFQAVSANGFIFSFTLLIALKLDHLLSHSWWFVFTPLWWLCHAIISRGRCSLPSPPMPHDENWTPFQYVMATPLLVAFEILLFLHLEDKYDVDLTFVFLPLLSFEVAILVVNLRKCLTRMPRNEETMSDEPLLYTWVSIWMVSFIAAITFTLVKSRAALELWDLSINFGIAELFGFLCAKWRKRSIHSDSHIPSSSSMGVRYGDEDSNIECGLLDIGGYVMKIPFITLQFILFLSLEGTPASPKKIPVLVLFVPLFLLQGAVVLSVTYISFSKSVLWIYNVGGPYGRYLARSSARVFLRFFQHCKRLLGCWSINEGNKEEQVRLHSGETTGYNTFSPKDALSEQTDSSQQEKNLCKVCFENPVNMVLLPCKHYVLCSTCCKKCKTCPICRELIKLRMPWTPFQYVMATPLLVAFEILLFLHLEDKYDDLKFVFLPLLAFEVAILVYNVSIAELFGFPVTKWRNQSIHRDSHILFSSSVGVRYRNEDSNRECDILDIGGYVMKIPFITFQIILFMSLKSVLWIYNVGGPYGRYLARSLARVFLRFFQHCKRLLGWWSIDKESKDSLLRRNKCNTLSPEAVKKMPKSHLVEEVCRLKAALSEQTDSSQQEKNICKVCFEDPVNVVLFPCRHHVLCSTCCRKCTTCPICRVLITHRVPVYDV
ncbi:hypothetical protein HID58_046941 [Brassica napus]|uniref:RING-type domain-containing protein n=1 Tax=Brassica napus TaxID=3708 RepID=A0ABQ8AY02_BRANA|nr:hypothetical protein HID58_046941 [Brassica napus]